MATNKTVKKHRGTLALLLGVLLMAAGCILLTRYGGRLEYILTAPAATQEGGELNAFYEDAQKQIAAIADSIEAGAVGARAQGHDAHRGRKRQRGGDGLRRGFGLFRRCSRNAAERSVNQRSRHQAEGECHRHRREYGAVLFRGR